MEKLLLITSSVYFLMLNLPDISHLYIAYRRKSNNSGHKRYNYIIRDERHGEKQSKGELNDNGKYFRNGRKVHLHLRIHWQVTMTSLPSHDIEPIKHIQNHTNEERKITLKVKLYLKSLN